MTNPRFYVLISSVGISVVVASLLRLQIASDQLYVIRLEQSFGYIALIYWYVVLMLSPLSKLAGDKKWMQQLLFVRRAIGVSVAYFALLHVLISVWGQLGGIGTLGLLPDFFKTALIFGVIGLGIVSVMALTSFDSVIRRMTYRRWKWLHRLGYIGGVLVIIHVWMIGTHVTYTAVQLSAAIALAVLFAFESYRMIATVAKRYPELQRKDYFYTLFLALWSLWVIVILAIPAFVQNYHQKRHVHPAVSVQVLERRELHA